METWVEVIPEGLQSNARCISLGLAWLRLATSHLCVPSPGLYNPPGEEIFPHPT